jgi:HSP20 family protein
MEKCLSNFFIHAPGTVWNKKEAMTVTEWAPLVDISEGAKKYVIKAEIPEMKKEGIKLNVNDDVLTITGERKYKAAFLSRKTWMGRRDRPSTRMLY